MATLLPKAAGWLVAAAGFPHAKGPVSKSLELVTSRFVRLGDPPILRIIPALPSP